MINSVGILTISISNEASMTHIQICTCGLLAVAVCPSRRKGNCKWWIANDLEHHVTRNELRNMSQEIHINQPENALHMSCKRSFAFNLKILCLMVARGGGGGEQNSVGKTSLRHLAKSSGMGHKEIEPFKGGLAILVSTSLPAYSSPKVAHLQGIEEAHHNAKQRRLARKHRLGYKVGRAAPTCTVQDSPTACLQCHHTTQLEGK